MKKGQKARILKNNAVGTISDSTFFTIDGKKHIRYELRESGEKEGRWYPAEELGPVKETIKVTVAATDGQELFANIEIDYSKSNLSLNLTGNPENLKEHKGAHMRIMSNLINNLNKM